MPSSRQIFGSQAERQAGEFLQRKGYRLLERHVTNRYGEIDLLMQDGETIVAVEVKSVRNPNLGRAMENITPQKLERLSRALNDLIGKRGWDEDLVRIDLVTVEPDGVQHLIDVGFEQD